MRRPISSITALCAVALLAAGLGACAGGAARERDARAEPAEETIAPVVRGVEAGLEARLWVVQARGGSIARALRDYGPPLAATPGSVDTWRRNGFRVIEVPVERLDDVRDQLPTIGPLHRQWLGILPEWVEVVKGASLGSEQPVMLDNGPVSLGPGRLRLLARCWAAPSVGAQPDGSPAGAVMRLEIMPELEIRAAGGVPLERLLTESPVPTRAGVRGIAFDRLLLGAVGSGSTALVIVPEDPAVDWRAQETNRPESIVEARSEDVTFGPQPAAVPTLGELMLTSLALPESVGDARIVVVLVPRAPERFELLPR